MTEPEYGPATRAVAAGRSAQGSSLATPLWASSTWESTSLADAAGRARALRPDEFYSRYANPTVRAFEEAMADLEGTASSLAFGSGMGALATVVLGLCSSGDHVVAQRQLYAGTTLLLQGPCARFGIETTFIDGTEPGAFAAAVRPGRTMLVIAESPTNPRLDVIDLVELGAIKGPFTVVDATFATPIGQQPATFGVDLVVHSATKGISGHNDATLGVVSGEAELLDAIWAYGVLHGAAASPFDALNGLKGLRTLAVRQRHQSETALAVARALRAHPGVSAVYHPGLDDHPHHQRALEQFDVLPGLVAIDLAGGADAAATFFDNVRIARIATSLGGPETLLAHPASTIHAALTPDDRAAIGITPGLVRISIGLEDPADLLADLCQAIPR